MGEVCGLESSCVCFEAVVKPLESLEGVVGRMVEDGEEAAAEVCGLSGRRNGEARGDPKERGEGLYEFVAGPDCEGSIMLASIPFLCGIMLIWS